MSEYYDKKISESGIQTGSSGNEIVEIKASQDFLSGPQAGPEPFSKRKVRRYPAGEERYAPEIMQAEVRQERPGMVVSQAELVEVDGGSRQPIVSKRAEQSFFTGRTTGDVAGYKDFEGGVSQSRLAMDQARLAELRGRIERSQEDMKKLQEQVAADQEELEVWGNQTVWGVTKEQKAADFNELQKKLKEKEREQLRLVDAYYREVDVVKGKVEATPGLVLAGEQEKAKVDLAGGLREAAVSMRFGGPGQKTLEQLREEEKSVPQEPLFAVPSVPSLEAVDVQQSFTVPRGVETRGYPGLEFKLESVYGLPGNVELGYYDFVRGLGSWTAKGQAETKTVTSKMVAGLESTGLSVPVGARVGSGRVVEWKPVASVFGQPVKWGYEYVSGLVYGVPTFVAGVPGAAKMALDRPKETILGSVGVYAGLASSVEKRPVEFASKAIFGLALFKGVSWGLGKVSAPSSLEPGLAFKAKSGFESLVKGWREPGVPSVAPAVLKPSLSVSSALKSGVGRFSFKVGAFERKARALFDSTAGYEKPIVYTKAEGIPAGWPVYKTTSLSDLREFFKGQRFFTEFGVKPTFAEQQARYDPTYSVPGRLVGEQLSSQKWVAGMKPLESFGVKDIWKPSFLGDTPPGLDASLGKAVFPSEPFYSVLKRPGEVITADKLNVQMVYAPSDAPLSYKLGEVLAPLSIGERGAVSLVQTRKVSFKPVTTSFDYGGFTGKALSFDVSSGQLKPFFIPLDFDSVVDFKQATGLVEETGFREVQVVLPTIDSARSFDWSVRAQPVVETRVKPIEKKKRLPLVFPVETSFGLSSSQEEDRLKVFPFSVNMVDQVSAQLSLSRERARTRVIVVPDFEVGESGEKEAEDEEQLEEKVVPVLPFGSPGTKKRKRPAFSVQVKTKGKWKTIAARLPEGLAKLAGVRATAGTAARTFKLTPAGKTARLDIPFIPKLTKYRRKKGKSKLPETAFVEKTRFAIDTPGEKREITMKGIKASKVKVRL